MKSLFSMVVALSTLNVVGAAQAGPKVGDPSPKLSIKSWIKGKAVDPTEGKPDEVFVVEFWATWCPPCRASIPHLSEMQAHFKSRGVTFIGISNEDKKTVKKFLKKGFDAKMRYTVAIDAQNRTNKDWMDAAGQKGIPTAFVVKGGKIRWIGHPMDGLDLKVAELCGDTKYVERKKRRKALDEQIQKAAEAKDWEGVLKGVNGVLELEPSSIPHLFAKYHLLLTKLKRADEGAKLGRKIVADCNDANRLDDFAWGILTNTELAGARDLKLALAASKKAMKLSKETSPSIIDTYARALADTGDLAGAIRWESRAIGLATEKRMKRNLERNLAAFKKRAEKEAA